MRLIQVGLGDFGQRWMEVVLEQSGWEYAGIATRNNAVRHSSGMRAGVPANRQFQSLTDAFSSGIEADAVLITTPYFNHTQDVLLALEHDMDVLVEKPLAGTWDEVAELAADPRLELRIVMVAENYRYSDAARYIRSVIQSDELGNIEYVGIQYFVRHEFAPSDWRNGYEYPVLIENATHHLDLLRYITGVNAVRVTSVPVPTRRTLPWPNPTATVLIEMQNSLVVQFTASWAYPEFETPWEGQWRIQGSKGAILWDRDSVRVSSTRRSEQLSFLSKDSDHTLRRTFAEFDECVRERRTPNTDIRDNSRTIGIVFAAIESSRTGHPVRLADMPGYPLDKSAALKYTEKGT